MYYDILVERNCDSGGDDNYELYVNNVKIGSTYERNNCYNFNFKADYLIVGQKLTSNSSPNTFDSKYALRGKLDDIYVWNNDDISNYASYMITVDCGSSCTFCTVANNSNTCT